MIDIAKCVNTGCPSAALCFRYTVIGSEYQSYSDFKPEEGEEKCEYFMDNKEWNKTKQ